MPKYKESVGWIKKTVMVDDDDDEDRLRHPQRVRALNSGFLWKIFTILRRVKAAAAHSLGHMYICNIYSRTTTMAIYKKRAHIVCLFVWRVSSGGFLLFTSLIVFVLCCMCAYAVLSGGYFLLRKLYRTSVSFKDYDKEIIYIYRCRYRLYIVWWCSARAIMINVSSIFFRMCPSQDYPIQYRRIQIIIV